MCQRIELRAADGAFLRMIEKASELAVLVGMDNLLSYAGDDEEVVPFATDDWRDGNWCLCPFALDETLLRAGYQVQRDDLGDVIATSPEKEG